MSVSFEGPAIMTRNMAECRDFYENVLEQEVLFDVGDAYVTYKGGFSLWEFSGAMEHVYGGPNGRTMTVGDGFELYFETRKLEEGLARLEQAGARLVHGIREQPWGQRCLRALDPEGRLLELGEPMSLVAERFLEQGLSVEETAQRTMLPVPLVQAMRDGDDICA